MIHIHQFYQNKVVLLTGCTGFIGKVILYRLLQQYSHISKIFILVRDKKGVPILTRIQKEILDSQCFDPLKLTLGNQQFNSLVNKLLHPIPGDLSKDNAGISDQDQQLLSS